MTLAPIKGELKLDTQTTREGTAQYKTPSGTMEFEWFRTDQAGVFLQFPSSSKWPLACDASSSPWAKELREDIRRDIIAQLVPSPWPNADTGEDGIHFYDADILKKEEEQLLIDSRKFQAPTLEEYLKRVTLHEFDFSDHTVFVIYVSEVNSLGAKARVTEMIRGNRKYIGEALTFGFDTAVPVEAGKTYLVQERESSIRQFFGSEHFWRCRLHVELAPTQIPEVSAFFQKLEL